VSGVLPIASSEGARRYVELTSAAFGFSWCFMLDVCSKRKESFRQHNCSNALNKSKTFGSILNINLG